MKKNLPAWVSILYVPGHDAEAMKRACKTAANAVIIDLEDFVPATEKNNARHRLAEHARILRGHGIDVIVRINRRLDLAVTDICAAVRPDVSAIMITKVANAEHLCLLDELVGELEHENGLAFGHIKLIAMIETASAISHIDAVTASVARLVAINVGAEDLAKEFAIPPDSPTLATVKQKMILAATAAGILPLGHLGSIKDFGDIERFSQILVLSHAWGFRGTTCLTEAQVDAVNAVYGTAPNKLEAAAV